MPSLPSTHRTVRLARMVAALIVVVAVTAVVVAVAAVALGVVALPLLLVFGFVGGTLLLPVTGSQLSLYRWMLADPVLAIVLGGLALLPLLYLGPVRSEIASFREDLGVHGRSSDGDLVRTVTNLARQADIAEPDVYVTRRRRPASYAIGGGSDGTVVLTSGLVEALPEPELRAVIAHEIAHLANGDSRLMGLALAPTLAVEHVASREPPGDPLSSIHLLGLPYLWSNLLWAGLSVVVPIQRVGNEFGLAAFSRERELAADRAAARLTGEPSALASALGTLSEERGPPEEDLRARRYSAGVLDILPAEQSPVVDTHFSTHPPTEERISRLRTLAGKTERA